MEGQRPHAWAWGLVALIAFGLALAGYLCFGRKGPAKPTVPVQTLTLGVEASLLPAAVWVAEAKDYFQHAGVTVRIEAFESGRLSLLAMLEGEDIDICTVAPTPIMFKSFERRDFRILATFAYSYDDVKVIARKDRGINTAADLRGARIATPSETTGAFVLAAFLTYNGLLPSDVEVVDLNPSDLAIALKRGEVDAVVIWEPHAHQARTLLAQNAIRLPTSEIYRETFNFVARKQFAEDHPDAIRRFLAAVDRATTFIGNYPQAAQAIVAQRLGLHTEALTELWDDFVFELSLHQSLLMTLEDEARWAIENRLTDETQVPNFLDLLHLDAMVEVKPEGVTIIR